MATWQVRTPDPALIDRLARIPNVTPLTARLLVSRGHTDPESVLRHLKAGAMGLHDPALFPGMQAATDRILRAMELGETILVHGDYDVDGVTGTSLLMRLFQLLDAKAVWHIPNRLVDGYSFGPHSIERAKATNAKVVISVDNGTSAFDVIAGLKKIGVDTIVTDHHEPPPGPLPDAIAIINPKLHDSTYPWRELCGGAVAFKLAWGVVQALNKGAKATGPVKAFLEEATAYVAIATVCDVVPLLDENRIFARYGLKALEQSKSPGLAALCKVAGIAGRPLTAEDVAFQIGPRINASGRLGSAHFAVECMLADDEESAELAAKRLDDLNKERREIEAGVLVEARAEAQRFPNDPVLVLGKQGWHQGVVGIVAARLTEEFGRPAIIIGLNGEEGRGSARTVGDFSVLEAMSGAAEVLMRFGGHTAAAGLEIRADKVDEARLLICARAKEMLAGEIHGEADLLIDHVLPFAEMNEQTMRLLDQLAPFGEQNEKPIFLSERVHLAREPRAVGADGSHLMLNFREGHHVLKAMAFRMGDRLDEFKMGHPVDIVYTPRWNTFRGQTNLEIQLLDFRPALVASSAPPF